MDEKIQVCAVYPDGLVRIYGETPKGSTVRPFVKSLQSKSYGVAVQFAIAFEEKEREELKKRQR